MPVEIIDALHWYLQNGKYDKLYFDMKRMKEFSEEMKHRVYMYLYIDVLLELEYLITLGRHKTDHHL